MLRVARGLVPKLTLKMVSSHAFLHSSVGIMMQSTHRSSPPDDLGQMPNYQDWTLADLQAEADRFAFRRSSNKKQLVKQLTSVWAALHDALTVEDDEAHPKAPSAVESTPKRRKRGRPAKVAEQNAMQEHSIVGISDSDDDKLLTQASLRSDGVRAIQEGLPISDAESSKSGSGGAPKKRGRPPGSKNKPKGKTLSDSSSSAEDEEAVLVGASSSEEEELEEEEEEAALEISTMSPQHSLHLKKAIRADFQLWRRILLMEPIPLDEIVSVANRTFQVANDKQQAAGPVIKTAKQRLELRSWLEMQGICVYTDELTGPRRRRR